MLVNGNDNHKQNCEYSEESVAFLYGELDESRKRQFSLHLENCAECADELNAFSSIHSSIRNWKSAKFDVLSTPVIKIPPASVQKPEKIGFISGSWLARLRERLSFTPSLIQIGVFAALLVCLGLGFYFLNFHNRNEIAVEKNADRIIKGVSPDTSGEIALKENSNLQNEGISKKAETVKPAGSMTKSPAVKESLPAEETARLKNSKNLRNSENNLKSPESVSNQEIKSQKINRNVSPLNNRSVPKLNSLPEETEDRDLRLTDLFDEIDTR